MRTLSNKRTQADLQLFYFIFFLVLSSEFSGQTEPCCHNEHARLHNRIPVWPINHQSFIITSPLGGSSRCHDNEGFPYFSLSHFSSLFVYFRTLVCHYLSRPISHIQYLLLHTHTRIYTQFKTTMPNRNKSLPHTEFDVAQICFITSHILNKFKEN